MHVHFTHVYNVYIVITLKKKLHFSCHNIINVDIFLYLDNLEQFNIL